MAGIVFLGTFHLNDMYLNVCHLSPPQLHSPWTLYSNNTELLIICLTGFDVLSSGIIFSIYPGFPSFLVYLKNSFSFKEQARDHLLPEAFLDVPLHPQESNTAFPMLPQYLVWLHFSLSLAIYGNKCLISLPTLNFMGKGNDYSR